MAQVTAAAVKAFRERTGLPLMDCKKALQEADGNEDQAIEVLRKRGQQLADKRSDRETAFGRFGLYKGTDKNVGAMVELLCESAPVTINEDFVQLADDLAEVLATGPGAETAEELLSQPSPSKSGMTLGEQRDEMFNRIREVFNVGRMIRVDGTSGGYMHHAGTTAGVLLQIEGGSDEAAKDVAMHVAAMKPAALDKDCARFGSGRKRAGNPDSGRVGRRKAGQHRRKDGRGSVEKLLCRTMLAAAALRQRRQAIGRRVRQGKRNESVGLHALGGRR